MLYVWTWPQPWLVWPKVSARLMYCPMWLFCAHLQMSLLSFQNLGFLFTFDQKQIQRQMSCFLEANTKFNRSLLCQRKCVKMRPWAAQTYLVYSSVSPTELCGLSQLCKLCRTIAECLCKLFPSSRKFSFAEVETFQSSGSWVPLHPDDCLME